MGTKGGDAALETIALLETRLQRLEFYTTGSDGSQRSTDELSSQEKQENIPSRLQRIETGLQQLAAQSQVVRDILRLCKTTVYAISVSRAYIDQTAVTPRSSLQSLQRMTMPVSPARSNWLS